MQIKELKKEGLSHTYAVTVSKEDLATKLEARLTHAASKKEIDEEVAKLAEGQKSYKKKAKTAKAKKGDAVLIDFVGTVDDVPFEGGAMEGHQLVLGSGSFIPGFEDELIGVKAC